MVEVQIWSAGEVPHGINAEVGVAHARLGYPLDVLITRGNNSQRVHLSAAEGRELFEQLKVLLPYTEGA